MNFDFKNGCENKFEDSNENSCSRLKKGSPLKIDLRADWIHESIPTAWELNVFIAGASLIVIFIRTFTFKTA